MNPTLLRSLQALPIAPLRTALRPYAVAQHAAEQIVAQGGRVDAKTLKPLYDKFVTGRQPGDADDAVVGFMVMVRQQLKQADHAVDELQLYGAKESLKRMVQAPAPRTLQDGMRRPG